MRRLFVPSGNPTEISVLDADVKKGIAVFTLDGDYLIGFVLIHDDGRLNRRAYYRICDINNRDVGNRAITLLQLMEDNPGLVFKQLS